MVGPEDVGGCAASTGAGGASTFVPPRPHAIVAISAVMPAARNTARPPTAATCAATDKGGVVTCVLKISRAGTAIALGGRVQDSTTS